MHDTAISYDLTVNASYVVAFLTVASELGWWVWWDDRFHPWGQPSPPARRRLRSSRTGPANSLRVEAAGRAELVVRRRARTTPGPPSRPAALVGCVGLAAGHHPGGAVSEAGFAAAPQASTS